MEELEVVLGQRCVPGIHGEQTLASSYAGLGGRHLLVLADGGQGQVPSRLAAQTAAAATIARVKVSAFPHPEEQLIEAFHEADAAIARAVLDSHAKGGAGCGLLAALVDGGRVTIARVGRGQAWMVTDSGLEAVFDAADHRVIGPSPATSASGDEVDSGPILEHRALPADGCRRLILVDAGAAAPVADALTRMLPLAQGGAPQLVATRLADTARDRGQYAPICVLIIEVGAPRSGHPPLPPADRKTRGILSADGRWLGSSKGSRQHRARAQSGWLLWLLLSVGLGALVALIIHGVPVDFGDSRAGTTLAPETAAPLDAEPATEAEAVPTDTTDTTDTTAGGAPDVLEAPGPHLSPELTSTIAEVFFDAIPPKRTARRLKSHIRRRFGEVGAQTFEELEIWLRDNPTPHAIAALLIVLKDDSLKRTQRWITALLPRLYAP